MGTSHVGRGKVFVAVPMDSVDARGYPVDPLVDYKSIPTLQSTGEGEVLSALFFKGRQEGKGSHKETLKSERNQNNVLDTQL